MTTTHSAKGLVWIDLLSPTEQEIIGIVKRYDLHPLVGEELKPTPSSSKVNIHRDYIVVVLNFPVRVKKNGSFKIEEYEIDFVIGKNFIITSHAESIEQLEYFAKIFETNNILSKESGIEHTGHLFYFMVKRLYSGVYEDIENVRDSVLQAEENIFAGNENRMVQALSNLSRELIDFRESVRIHMEVWNEMMIYTGNNLFGENFRPYIKDIHDEFNRIHELIQNSKELVGDLKSTNDSLLNTKQNNIIRTLTLINFIFIPATFIAALFTIPAVNVPLIDKAFGWHSLFALMLAITLTIWIIFKTRKWI